MRSRRLRSQRCVKEYEKRTESTARTLMICDLTNLVFNHSCSHVVQPQPTPINIPPQTDGPIAAPTVDPTLEPSSKPSWDLSLQPSVLPRASSQPSMSPSSSSKPAISPTSKEGLKQMNISCVLFLEDWEFFEEDGEVGEIDATRQRLQDSEQ